MKNKRGISYINVICYGLHMADHRVVNYTPQLASSVKRLLKDEPWYFDFFTDAHYTCFALVVDDEVVGVAVTSIVLDTAELDFIFVHPDYRKKRGFGSELFNRVELHAREQKAAGLRVNFGSDNAQVRSFYAKMGMHETGRVDNYFSNDVTQIFYWKDLRKPLRKIS
jgi:ribosomal protein S18 acetylase RimI-like enzyme